MSFVFVFFSFFNGALRKCDILNETAAKWPTRLPARQQYLPKDLTFALSAVSTEPTDASETFCFSGVCSMLTRMYTALNTHTHTHTPLYKNAFLVRLFTDVYQHHTVCTAFSAAECQWQQTRLPLDCKCESSAFTPVTSRHLLLM